MRMIDADALWEIFREKQNILTARCGGYRLLDGEDMEKYDRLEITLAYIENAPEVDAVPVVRGEWRQGKEFSTYPRVPFISTAYYCSNCEGEAYWDTDYGQQLFGFCPNCGAKMEGKP